jgi:protein-disulfide isomerase
MESARLLVPVGLRDHVVGPRSAPVTLLEYGDLACPATAAAHAVVKALLSRRSATLRFAWRHFPLTALHPRAERAAEACEAAGAQDRFWEMHEVLSDHAHALRDEDLVRYAEDLPLDVERFLRDLESSAYANRVLDDLVGGARSGVSGTPTFFVNGVRHDGPWDLDALCEAIDHAVPVAA